MPSGNPGWRGCAVQWTPTGSVRLAPERFMLRRGGREVVNVRREQAASPKLLHGLAVEQAIAQIEKLGGHVAFDPELTVDLSHTGMTDRDLGCLKEFPGLQKLVLNGPNLSGAGLDVLRGMPRLRWLQLRGLTRLNELDLGKTRVTSSGAAELASALPGLKIIPSNGEGSSSFECKKEETGAPFLVPIRWAFPSALQVGCLRRMLYRFSRSAGLAQ